MLFVQAHFMLPSKKANARKTFSQICSNATSDCHCKRAKTKNPNAVCFKAEKVASHLFYQNKTDLITLEILRGIIIGDISLMYVMWGHALWLPSQMPESRKRKWGYIRSGATGVVSSCLLSCSEKEDLCSVPVENAGSCSVHASYHGDLEQGLIDFQS